MLDFFKKSNTIKLTAPVTGRIIPIEEVPDPTFSQKILGDGIAIEATGNAILAPADGTITLIADTQHAFGMLLNNGLEVIVHVGLETVKLNGSGFTVLVEPGSKVKEGTAILSVDLDLIHKNQISLITPVVILNSSKSAIINKTQELTVNAGDLLIEVS